LALSLADGGKQASVELPEQGVVGVQLIAEQVNTLETLFSLVKVNVTGLETESPTVALMVVIGRGPPFTEAGVDFRGMFTLND